MKITGKRYLDYSSYIKSTFGERVQKISLNIGFSCPNRDGSKGYGGCTYCNNETFNPDYCEPSKSISLQLTEGISRFSKKYKAQKYLAYFQAYTNTYSDFESLKAMYDEALNVPGVVGLVIGTRPDCISDEVIDYLALLSKTAHISLEFGVESTLNKTLKRVNRCHTFEDTIAAYEKCKNKGFHLGAHVIMGLPGESKAELLNHAATLSKLPINSLKMHHLQIVKQSIMAYQYKQNPEDFNLFSSENYIEFIAEFIGLLRPDIIIERFVSEAPKDLLIAPNWHGLKNFEVVDKIDKKLTALNTWQGKYYNAINTKTKA
ncbi:TIGR01212 family radical SAM protein [Pseudotamlana carrageenivorans]|uniref:TIGR01212 family radical SAM protein n=1 Tax=Pseudotamlana carrageenivorans TaxID=2069432 RepID=A0A2I7SEX1_9FLAO|nr:TIGR01212 family radical SAM protein [Tamlana carrageenivorans]AUS04451.1 TIGR01212 family radical SAM protein [Tamlana carrageenivorans]